MSLVFGTRSKPSCGSNLGCARKRTTFAHTKPCCPNKPAEPKIPAQSDWTDFPLVFVGSVAPDPKAADNPLVSSARYIIDNKTMHVQYHYTHDASTNAGAQAGAPNGTYKVKLPALTGILDYKNVPNQVVGIDYILSNPPGDAVEFGVVYYDDSDDTLVLTRYNGSDVTFVYPNNNGDLSRENVVFSIFATLQLT